MRRSFHDWSCTSWNGRSTTFRSDADEVLTHFSASNCKTNWSRSSFARSIRPGDWRGDCSPAAAIRKQFFSSGLIRSTPIASWAGTWIKITCVPSSLEKNFFRSRICRENGAILQISGSARKEFACVDFGGADNHGYLQNHSAVHEQERDSQAAFAALRVKIGEPIVQCEHICAAATLRAGNRHSGGENWRRSVHWE